MFAPDQYELLDFGSGRKLERFGTYILDRPSPAADGASKQNAQLWKQANAKFERSSGETGRWTVNSNLPKSWTITHDIGTFELKLTDFGHVGVFPEQAANWAWIVDQVSRAKRPLKVLNLFAYTGGSTLAAASAGAQVVHVDSAKSVVNWARNNANESGLSDAPIRWICEDAFRFVHRELKRGNTYDAVVLDPPAYGHGPKGEVWKIADHLIPLLGACGELTETSRAFMLLTCHSAGFGPAEVEASLLDSVFGACQAGVASHSLSLNTNKGGDLPSGVAARWPAADE